MPNDGRQPPGARDPVLDEIQQAKADALEDTVILTVMELKRSPNPIVQLAIGAAKQEKLFDQKMQVLTEENARAVRQLEERIKEQHQAQIELLKRSIEADIRSQKWQWLGISAGLAIVISSLMLVFLPLLSMLL